ncbi:MAG TPA: GAF domain-containing protein [Dehalococcoidia bacterium]|nr:GAF domain-containing protein [Dehalococcoidia bacterium]
MMHEVLGAVLELDGADLEVRTYVRSILDRLRVILGADAACVLWGPDEDKLTFYATAGLDVQAEGLRVPVDDSVAGRVIRSRAPVNIDDLSAVGEARPALRDRYASALGVPLILGGTVAGVLGLVAARKGAFDERTVSLLRGVSTFLAALVSHDRTLAELARLASALDAANSLEATALTAREYLNALLQRIVEVVKGDAAAAFWADSGGEWLTLYASVGLDAPDGFKLPFNVGITGRVAAGLKAMRVPDTALVETADPELAETFRSVIACPLVLEGRAAGVVAIGAREVDFFSDSDLELLASFSGRFALMMDRERVKAEAKELSAHLLAAEENVRQSLAFDLHDRVAQSAAASLMFLEALSARFRPRGKEARQLLDSARAQAEVTARETRALINELRSPESSGRFFQESLVNAVSWLAEATNVQLDVAVDLSGGAADDQVLVQALRIAQEAVNNAVKYSGAPFVRVEVRSDADACYVRVEDEGRGFEISDVSESRKGIGLASMRARCAVVGGRLTLDSAPGKGTRVIARLPLRAA